MQRDLIPAQISTLGVVDLGFPLKSNESDCLLE